MNYGAVTRVWSKDLNSVWLARHYLAIKMILASSVMLTSLEYASKKNLRIVEPYLIYYSLLNCCRALTFTQNEQCWRDGGLMNMTHQKIINVAVDAIKKFSRPYGEYTASLLDKSKQYREMFSYKFPANGIKLLSEDGANEIDEAIGVCSIICEMAQLNSECLQTSIEDYVKDKSEVDMDVLKVCFMYETSDGVIHDGEDLYRTSYFKRHNLKPLNLFWCQRQSKIDPL